MKKILSVAAISLCVLGAAGAAHADFAKSDLTQVIYQELGPLTMGTVEYGTSLIKNFQTFDLTQTNVMVAPVGNIPAPSTYGMSWSQMRLGFYADYYSGTASKFYFATTSPTTHGFSAANISAFDSSVSSVATLYNSNILPTNSQTALVDPSQQLNSYDQKMNGKSTGPGLYSGLNNAAPAIGEANLGLLDSQDHVDMYLYQFGRVGSAWMNIAGASTPYVATLRFNLDGSTVFNPVDAAAVPAPASMLLLGSGLIGLLGLRRKKN